MRLSLRLPASDAGKLRVLATRRSLPVARLVRDLLLLAASFRSEKPSEAETLLHQAMKLGGLKKEPLPHVVQLSLRPSDRLPTSAGLLRDLVRRALRYVEDGEGPLRSPVSNRFRVEKEPPIYLRASAVERRKRPGLPPYVPHPRAIVLSDEEYEARKRKGLL